MIGPPRKTCQTRPSADTPREYRGIALRRHGGGAIVRAPTPPEAPPTASRTAARTGQSPDSTPAGSPIQVLAPTPFSPPRQRVDIDRMDAKQVWRAALGELQVSLSPANFETWLRDTALVEVDDNRFRIAVPNGFAKDWLETRYRSLIAGTLARIVGYSVQVEFLVSAAAESEGATS